MGLNCFSGRVFVSYHTRLRGRHEAARDEYVTIRKAIFKELELEVSLLGKTLKERLAASEADLAVVIAGLDDEKVVNLTLEAIDQQWTRIQDEFESRQAWIDKLSNQFNNVEMRRGVRWIGCCCCCCC